MEDHIKHVDTFVQYCVMLNDMTDGEIEDLYNKIHDNNSPRNAALHEYFIESYWSIKGMF